MPFTISHAAAVLPLRKLRLPLAAMMIGSMAPDFPYFLPGDLSRTETHDLEGIFRVCWPMGLAVWLLFVHLLERPSIELLPEPWRTRMPHSDSSFTFKSLALASLGVIVGALTHVAWDAFTHAATPMTRVFPLLSESVFSVRGRYVPVYFVLQVLSSLLGLIALAWWALRLRHDKPKSRAVPASRIPLSDRARVGILIVMIGISVAAGLATYAGIADAPFERRIFHALINGMTSGLLAWCVAAAIFAYLPRFTARS
jgi:membrane-bound metal-dependent hydrolase YbcI (DUF457 family)